MKQWLVIFWLMFAWIDHAETDVLHRDVTYQTVDGVPVRLDIATPKDQGDGPFPLIVCFHGGAFRMGDKSKFTSMIEKMAGHGYVAVSANYRLSPKYRWPSQLEDARTAVRFLKAHAAEYGIDVGRVGLTGESAGSQLAMLLAFEPDAAGTTPLMSTRAKAVVNFYGPVDLTHWEVAPLMNYMWHQRFNETLEESMAKFIGTNDPKDPKVIGASPITYVDDNCPPVLTFHGTLDPMVPYHQAEELHAALKKCGVAEQLVPIPNGMHGAWAASVKCEADDKALAFFDTYLKAGPVKKMPAVGPITAVPRADKAAVNVH